MKLTASSMILALVVSFLVGCNREPYAPAASAADDTGERDAFKAPDGLTQPPLDVIKGYCGRELEKLNEAQAKELLAAITTLVPNRTYRDWFDFRPWFVWDFSNGEQPLLLLLEVDNTHPHPGSTGIRITVFDKSGNVQSETAFWTGHRCYMRRICLEDQAKGQQPILVIETGPGAGPGPNVQKQVYARLGDRFDLVRLENSDGTATRNQYYIGHFACGPEIVKQTERDWEADVLSSDRMRILRALVWLGGSHWDLREGDIPENQHEAFEQVQLVHQVRGRPKVVTRLKELCKSEDLWLREAAQLAADPQDARW